MIDKLIVDNYKSLNATDIHVVNYIMEHKKNVPTLTLQELADEVNLSKTTVHRCIKKLGFSGFNEFKILLKNNLRQNTVPATYSAVDIQKQMMFGIESTIKLVDHHDLNIFFEKLKNAKRVYAYGTGWKQKTALNLFLNDLPAFGIYPIEVRTIPDFLIALKSLTKDDLVIILSLSGETEDLKQIVQQLYVQGIPLVAITGSKVNYLATHSTLDFTYYDDYRETAGFSMPWSSLNIHALLDYMLGGYAQYLRKIDEE